MMYPKNKSSLRPSNKDMSFRGHVQLIVTWRELISLMSETAVTDLSISARNRSIGAKLSIFHVLFA